MSTQALKKTLNVFGNALFVILLIMTILLAFFVVKSKIDGGTPTVAGNKLLVVLSGSMEPVFSAGSIIGVKEIAPEAVAVGDIITFKDPTDPNRIITHRVLEINDQEGALSFATKGDANDAADNAPVPGENLIGKETFTIPYAGYLAEFTKSKKGMVALLIVPGALFILNELRNLFKLAEEYEKEQKKKKADAEHADASS